MDSGERKHALFTPTHNRDHPIPASEVNMISSCTKENTNVYPSFGKECVFVHSHPTDVNRTTKAKVFLLSLPVDVIEIIWLLCICADGEKVLFSVRRVEKIVKVVCQKDDSERSWAKVDGQYYELIRAFCDGSSLYRAIKHGLEVDIDLYSLEREGPPPPLDSSPDAILWKKLNRECEIRTCE